MSGLAGDSDGLPVNLPQTENLFLRTCLVEINNSSGFYTLSEPGLFMVGGECEAPLAPEIQRRSQVSATFVNMLGTATGAVGVFTYNLLHNKHRDYNAVLAVMFSVPFDYNLYSNWCGAGIFYRGTPCNNNLFDLMYYGSEEGFVRAEGGAGIRIYMGEVVKVTVSVSDSRMAVLRVDIKDLTGGAGEEGGAEGSAEGPASSIYPL